MLKLTHCILWHISIGAVVVCFSTANGGSSGSDNGGFGSIPLTRGGETHEEAVEEEEDDCYEGCFCAEGVMTCKKFRSISKLEKLENAASIVRINIEDQPDFIKLGADDLAQFVNLINLSIRKSGLKIIEDGAFLKNKKLKHLDLSSNQLASFDWRLVRHDSKMRPLLSDNPLRCSCSLLFLFNSLSKPTDVSDDDDDYDYDYDDNDDDDDGGNDHEDFVCFEGYDGNRAKRYNVSQFPGSRECAFPTAHLDENLTVANGSEATAFCRGRPANDPRLKVNWRSTPEGRDFEGDVVMSALSQSEVTMTIGNLNAVSSGTYHCEVENEDGFDVATWQLLVSSSPMITQLSRMDFHPDVCLLFEVVGHPRPAIRWFKDGVAIALDDDDDADISRAEENVDVNVVRGNLRLASPIRAEGNFTLVAMNVHGSDNRSLTVELGVGKPPQKHNDSYSLGFKNLSSGQRMSGNETGNKSSYAKPVLIALIIIIVFLVVVIAIILGIWLRKSPKRAPGQFQGEWFKRKPSKGSSKRQEGVRKNRLAAFCLHGPQTDRPVRRENIPLSIDHVVQNPNYEKGDSIRGSQGFGRGGFMDERCLLRLSAVPKIPSSDIECLQELGEGAFGLVYLGTLKTRDPLSKEYVKLPVAIKTVKDCQLENNRMDFDREATMLSGLKHENIVTLYGVSVDRQPHMIILEYMEFGDLCNFLRTNGPDGKMLAPRMTNPLVPRPILKRPLTSLDLLSIAVQIARGGAYLAQQHFVHRDLATRNCLVGADLVVKIGDFGMSRDVYATDYYKVGSHLLMPVRWMPPESIVYRTFTVETDVWSFGVVLWEIYTFGKQPWYELSNTEVIQQVQQGEVMTCPGNCPPEVYAMMLKCWHKDPRERISMEKMYNQLDGILQLRRIRLHGVDGDEVRRQPIDKSPRVKHPTYLELIDN